MPQHEETFFGILKNLSLSNDASRSSREKIIRFPTRATNMEKKKNPTKKKINMFGYILFF